MEYIHVQNLENYVEGQGVPLGEILVEEQVNGKMDIFDEKLQAKEETELMNIRKYLHHYKDQNTHLNQLNDHLVNSNLMTRKDIEEINSNNAKLVQVAEEAVKRRKMAHETNDKLLKHNQELQEKLLTMEKELS